MRDILQMIDVLDNCCIYQQKVRISVLVNGWFWTKVWKVKEIIKGSAKEWWNNWTGFEPLQSIYLCSITQIEVDLRLYELGLRRRELNSLSWTSKENWPDLFRGRVNFLLNLPSNWLINNPHGTLDTRSWVGFGNSYVGVEMLLMQMWNESILVAMADIVSIYQCWWTWCPVPCAKCEKNEFFYCEDHPWPSKSFQVMHHQYYSFLTGEPKNGPKYSFTLQFTSLNYPLGLFRNSLFS